MPYFPSLLRAITLLACLILPRAVSASAEWPHPIRIDPDFPAAGASEFPEIDESTIARIVYVDQTHSLASDDNPGTAELPLRSIQAAGQPVIASLMAGIPTKVVIGPGVYHEKPAYAFQLPKHATEAQRNTLFVIEGVPGKTLISGAVQTDPELDLDLRPGAWQPVSGSDHLYVNDWPHTIEPDPGPWIDTYGFAMLPRTLQRPEMIWVDGEPLFQLYTERYEWVDPDGVATMLDPGPGIVDTSENNQPGKLVYRRHAYGTPAEFTLPMSFGLFSAPESPEHLRGKVFLKLDRDIREVDRIETGRWIKPWSPLLVLSKRGNFVVRGIGFTQNMAAWACPALVVADAGNFIIEDCTFNNNSSLGLSIARSKQGIIRRCQANNNAANGIVASQSRQLLFEDIETHFNCYRAGWNAFLGWDASGFKSGGVHNITVRRHSSIGNYANGIWYDVYCTDILVEDSFYLGNQRMGVMIEFTRPRGGPQIVRNNVVAFNRNGIFVAMAANSVVENNLVIENHGGHVEHNILHAQLLYKFQQRKGGPQNAADWESVRIAHNVFAARSGSITDYTTRKAEPRTQFPFILEVLDTDHNLYYLPDPAHAFRSNDGSWLDLEGWRALLAEFNAPGGRDAHSSWADSIPWENDPRLEFTASANSGVTRLARQMGVPLPEPAIRTYWDREAAGRYAPPYLHFEKLYD